MEPPEPEVPPNPQPVPTAPPRHPPAPNPVTPGAAPSGINNVQVKAINFLQNTLPYVDPIKTVSPILSTAG